MSRDKALGGTYENVMKILSAVAILSCLTLSAAAADAQAPSLGETPLSLEELDHLTSGSTLVFADEGRARFGPGKIYSYTYSDSQGRNTDYGIFEVRPDGRVCIDFAGGHRRCDLYVREDKLLMLITEKGGRIPFRVELGLE